MPKTYKNSYKRNKKTPYFILLAVALLLTILMIIGPTREWIVALLGWAVCAYIPAMIALSVFLLIGKRPSIKLSRAAIYVGLFVFAVCTLHIMLSKSYYSGFEHQNESYISSAIKLATEEPNTGTVGGALIATLIAPVKLLIKNYGIMLAVYFVITAGLGLAALFPAVLNIKDFSVNKKSKKENTVTTNPIHKETELYSEKARVDDAAYASAIDSFSSYGGKTPTDKRNLFENLGTPENTHQVRAQESANILFNPDVQPARDTENVGSKLKILSENDDRSFEKRFYTNQGRTSLFNPNTVPAPTAEDGYRRETATRVAETPANDPIGALYAERKEAAVSPSEPTKTATPRTMSALEYINTPISAEEYVSPFGDMPATKPIEHRETRQESDFGIPKQQNTGYQTSIGMNTTESVQRVQPKAEPDYVADSPFKIDFSAKDPANTGRPVQPPLQAKAEPEYVADSPFKIDFSAKDPANTGKPVQPPLQPKTEQTPAVVKPVEPKEPSKPVQTNLFGTEKATPAPVKIRPYVAPSLDLLKNYPSGGSASFDNYSEMKEKIECALAEFRIQAEVVSAKCGPSFTRYEIILGAGLPVSKITSIQDNLTMRLCATSLRIIAPIKGKNAIGIELPNKKREVVGLRSVLASPEFTAPKGGIRIGFGKTLDGTPYVADLADMPHMLVAGATGTGKSVFINSLITSIIYKYSPEDVRLLLIDPKRVEMTVYQGLPHLLVKDTVKDPAHAVNLLTWLTNEMDRRYKFLEQCGCDKIDVYNDSVRDKRTEPKMPRIVLIVDEMADLMMTGKGQVETFIVRIAQLGRACGIHLVLATQRPTANVITGLIKSNILARVAFTVKTSLDSRIILDEMGAESLLGKGDMIYSCSSENERLQGALVEKTEIANVCDFIRAHNEGVYDDAISKAIFAEPVTVDKGDVESRAAVRGAERDAEFESLIKKILRTFIIEKKASVSLAQARHNVGYLRAKKLVDAMCDRGYISKDDGSKARKVLITQEEYDNEFRDDEDGDN